MNTAQNIDVSLLKDFAPISLSEMDEVKLMNRTDTKFVLEKDKFLSIFNVLSQDYKVLEVKGNRISNYKTLYFDTPNFQYFLDHHNGKGNRFKIRIRNYVESGLYFLEIKNKFKGRTDKHRITVKDFETILKGKSKKFVDEVIGEGIDLEDKLWNSFGRITLVNQKDKERLTLDVNLTFEKDEQKIVFPHIIIAELKQEKVNRNSPFYSLMKNNQIRPYSISKYCIGAVSLNPSLKYNNFKEKMLLIDKLK